jgi:hypothetical protein
LLELTFDTSLANAGTAGGEAEVRVYAEGEDPYLMPGPWGDCLDLTAAARFGGTLADTGPAGSALVYRNAAVDSLGNFTVTLWMRGAPDTREVASRVLTKFGSWELMYAGGRPSLVTVQGDSKKGHRCPALPAGNTGEWTFVAASVERDGGSLSLHLGTRDGGLTEPATEKLDHLPAQVESELQVGNFNDIRPFKGWLDNLRIYAAALSAEQVRAVFAGDVENWSAGESVYSFGVPVRRGRFRMKQSDIPFRVLSQKRLDSLKGFDVMEACHATHLFWVYGNDPEYVRRTHEKGIFYQASQNGMCGFGNASADRSADGDPTGRQQDLDGNKVVLPHMAKWRSEHPQWTGCHNNPDFRKLFFEESDAFVKLGVDSLHVDDWMMAYSTASAGLSCFCPACLAGFREYLKQTLSAEELKALGIEDLAPFDYRAHLKAQGIENQEQYRKQFRDLPLTPHFLAFQAEGLRDFYAAYRRHLDQASPDKYLPISVNNQFCRRDSAGGFLGASLVDRLDFLIGEAFRSMQTVTHYVLACKVAEALSIPQIMKCKPEAIAHSQAMLATTYALGQWFRVPWDVYMDNDANGQAAPRYFGKLEDWKPLYDFIHDHPQLFEEQQTAAVVGVLFNLDAQPYQAVWDACDRLTNLKVPFRLLAGTGAGDRATIDAEALKSIRFVVQLHSTDGFCQADRQVLATAKASRRVRFLDPDADLPGVLREAERSFLRVEGPENVFAFLRVKPDDGSAAIHVVNWNAKPDGTNDPFGGVTLSLAQPKRWGENVTFTWYAPGQGGGLVLKPEEHRDCYRLTIPQLGVWSVVEVRARAK